MKKGKILFCIEFMDKSELYIWADEIVENFTGSIVAKIHNSDVTAKSDSLGCITLTAYTPVLQLHDKTSTTIFTVAKGEWRLFYPTEDDGYSPHNMERWG